MESVQRIMVRAEEFWESRPADCSLEHPAQRHSTDDASVDAKTNDPSGELVHHHQNPIGSQGRGFAAKQIATLQAVFGVAVEGQPRWTSRIRCWQVMDAQDPANHVLVEFNPKSECDLLSDKRAAPARITSFHRQNGVDECFGRALGARTTPALGRKQRPILALPQPVVKTQQSGRLQNDRGAHDACPADEERAQTGDDPVPGVQVRRAFTASI